MEKHGFVYIWYDRKHKRYYIGCRWGREDDGYICSSNWMKQAYSHRPEDFRRRIIKTNIPTREQTYLEEMHYLQMIKDEEIKIRYYNLNNKNNEVWHKYDEHIKTVGQKISLAKKGKSTGPCSPEKAAKISEAKKAKNRKFTEEHKEKLRQAKLGIKHTDEWKEENSKRMKDQWSDPYNKRKQAVSAAAKKRWEEYRLNKLSDKDLIQSN
jgi:hypothetical protein